ncbi:MFS transporter [Nocardia salmonicida]|uniref:MFS transporter n=1 Tax=Nocardia salmonicida TaxID=53431 RepID=UPI0007A4B9FE|nr:MFS transporter [Nocardia salmonicida]
MDEQRTPDTYSGAPATGFAESDLSTGTAPMDRRMRRLLTSVPFATATVHLGVSVSGYFLALQIQAIDADAKVANLAIAHALGAVAAMIAQPLIGVLSDRTRTRTGARAPWILTGALIGSTGLITAGLSTTIAMLVVAAMIIQFGFNTLGGPLSAILPDRVPTRLRGRYSTLAGLGSISAAILGPILASLFVGRIPLGYTTAAGVIIVIAVTFVLLNPDTDNRGLPRTHFSIRAFLVDLWVDPRRYPDFAWAFLGRLLIFGGYFMVLTYMLYLMQGYVGLSVTDAAKLVPIVGAAGMPGFLVAIVVSGPLSDRTGRRKPLVLVGGFIVAAALVIPLISPTVAGMFAFGIVATIGFGIFTAVDVALVSEVLPAKDGFAKDLGILNIAVALPSVLAPALAAAVVTISGSYGAVFATAAVITVIGALAVLPIKSVR